jgi:transposase
MQVLYPRCCGLDVHKRSVVACVLLTGPDGVVERHLSTFGTMTADLLALHDWLAGLGVTHIALESTGIYWRPVYNLLEGEGRTILLVNPQHLKAVPGRKTDVRDAEWLADLLRHGLLRASFIPPLPIRDLRDLTRYRTTLVRQRADEVNRLHKLLETANLKLAAVASDVAGASGRAMLTAILGGEADPAALAELAKGRLRQKLPALRLALEGRVRPHHRVLLGQLLAHVEFLEESIAEVQAEVERRLAPFEAAVALLQTIPGVGPTAAATIVAEVGVDMDRFPTAKHLASWAGLCPGNKQSGGRRLSGATPPGNRWLRGMLGEVAWAIARSKDNYLRAHYNRIARRRGKYKAAVAVAHSALVVIYHVLKTGHPYADLGPDYFDRLDADRVERHHVRRLEHLGYTVTLSPKEAA